MRIEQLPDEVSPAYLRLILKQYAEESPVQSIDEARAALVCRFGFPSWHDLECYVSIVAAGNMTDLERSIVDDDYKGVKTVIARDPAVVHREVHWKGRSRHNHYLPLSYAAYCGSVKAMRGLLEAHADVHAAEEQALRVASCFDRNVEAVSLLLDSGAAVNATMVHSERICYSVLDYPCMTLAPGVLQLLIERGATPKVANAGMIIASNERRPSKKASCIEVLCSAGFEFPDTAPMAIHRRDTDRISSMIEDGALDVNKRFQENEIFPDGYGIHRPSPYAYVTPLLGGVTLLHMAVELCDTATAAFLLSVGADVNARSDVCANGYGGWTPIFHTVATLHQPRCFADLAELLLESGTDPGVRASIRKPMVDDNGGWSTWRDVTAVEFARSLSETGLVNETAIELIENASVRPGKKRV